MNKFMYISLLIFSMVSSAAAMASEKKDLLIDFKKDIFAEIIRSHGKQIETEVLLRWCQFDDLANEIGLTENALKRVVYDSFVVAGTDNVKATEIARKMADESWDLYNFSLFSDLSSYREGLKKGLDISYSEPDMYKNFCHKVEDETLEEMRIIPN
ncbi:hypothetical protein KDX31_16390 [Amphritea atlantica]|uniref:Uncharacterized protein n=1 Tax=Amphritea atlantica TaxID=355243 RepID=A0ABY5GSF2_9GAMM|nr:hypothetical protein KDX31_16390 [Amphritea atlantica]